MPYLMKGGSQAARDLLSVRPVRKVHTRNDQKDQKVTVLTEMASLVKSPMLCLEGRTVRTAHFS